MSIWGYTFVLARSFIRKLRWALVRALAPLALMYCSLEYLLLLTKHFKQLRSAEYVNSLWFWSFGHQSVDLHMLTMHFHGSRLLVLLSDYNNFNRHLVSSFQGVVDIVFLQHSRLMHLIWGKGVVPIPTLHALKYKVLALVLWLLKSSAEIVEFPNFHRSFGPQIAGGFAVEYIRLLHSEKTIEIKPPQQVIVAVRELLSRSHPKFADKWFISLYLRRKSKGTVDVRDADQFFYRKVIERIGELGGFVFLGGDADPQIFSDLMNWLGYANVSCERSLIDLYFLSQCRFLICVHSGPHAVGSLFKVPILITNCGFYWQSGWCSNQVIIYKKLRDRRNGRVLSAKETFSVPTVTYSDTIHFQNAGFEWIDNTETEIMQATEEMIARYILGQEIVQADDWPLYDRFRSLLPPQSVAYQSPTRPALSYLRSLKWE